MPTQSATTSLNSPLRSVVKKCWMSSMAIPYMPAMLADFRRIVLIERLLSLCFIKPIIRQIANTEKTKAWPNLSVNSPMKLVGTKPPLLEVQSTNMKIAHAMAGNWYVHMVKDLSNPLSDQSRLCRQQHQAIHLIQMGCSIRFLPSNRFGKLLGLPIQGCFLRQGLLQWWFQKLA